MPFLLPPSSSMSTAEYSKSLAAAALRIDYLTPKMKPVWGRMTSHQLLCHLADSYRIATGSKPAEPVHTWFSRNIVKFVALQTPFAFPKNFTAPKEVAQEYGGTAPTEFQADRETLHTLIEQFRHLPATHFGAEHPIMGPLTREQWLNFHCRHLDHHLRQFGL